MKNNQLDKFAADMGRRPGSKGKKKNLLPIIIPSAIVLVGVICYFLFAYSNIGFIAKWREQITATALSTADHQWIAYLLFPDKYVDEMKAEMEKEAKKQNDVTGGMKKAETKENGETEEPQMPDDHFPKVDDILNQKNINVGDTDYAGYKITVNDVEEGLVVSEIVEKGFRGMIMLIDDPSRVYVGNTTTPNVEGLRMPVMMSTHGAVAGINASGFADPNESGNGGQIIGRSYSNGVAWGNYVNYYGSVILTNTDHLVVGNTGTWEDKGVRDGIQFGPVLIADGVVQEFSERLDLASHPRTCIGQRADGVIAFCVIDGRQPGWSSGCSASKLAEILQKYNIINAACCDGGSSSILAYKDKILNRNSSLNPSVGRRLPNAFLVKPKSQS